jgi:Uma2 family endonuclease
MTDEETTMATAILDQPLSASRFESERLFEIVKGERREKQQMSVLAIALTSALSEFLSTFVRNHKLGWVVVEMLFQRRADRPQRRPDLAFVSYQRGQMPPPEEDVPAWNVIPNLAVEVISPTNTAKEVMGKVLEYIDAGVELVWVIYPAQCIQVFDSRATTRLLWPGDELDGGRMLPGFKLGVRELFESIANPK